MATEFGNLLSTSCRAASDHALHPAVLRARVLVVGAGGVGSEVAKTLLGCGFRRLTLVDLDTIDRSNLNRQFLFRRADVGERKCQVAAQRLREWMAPATAADSECPLEVDGLHGNVMDSARFDVLFYRQFDVVVNALDNAEARRQVNGMCLAADRPLVETGSTGYLGQVMPVLPFRTECYECTPKPPPRQYAVCTIRSTPDRPVHCVVWARHLFQALFGKVSNDTDADGLLADLDCRPEAGEPADTYAHRLLHALYVRDVEAQRGMEDLWRGRRAPEPLPLAELLPQAEARLPHVPYRASAQEAWPLVDWLAVFWLATRQLSRRLSGTSTTRGGGGGGGIPFDKDDTDALLLVAAAANLRAHCYHIAPLPSAFQVKGIAGNIVHAVAATNAVVAGLAVTEVLKYVVLSSVAGAATTVRNALRSVFVRRVPAGTRDTRRLLQPERLHAPHPHCPACSIGKVAVEALVDAAQVTLGDWVRDCLCGLLGVGRAEELSISVLSSDDKEHRPGIAVLYEQNAEVDDGEEEEEEELWRRNAAKSLAALRLGHGSRLHVTAVDRAADPPTALVMEVCLLWPTTAVQASSSSSSMPWRVAFGHAGTRRPLQTEEEVGGSGGEHGERDEGLSSTAADHVIAVLDDSDEEGDEEAAKEPPPKQRRIGQADAVHGVVDILD